MNRFAIKIEFKDRHNRLYGLKIIIIHWDKRFLKDELSRHELDYFYSRENMFSIYSSKDGFIGNDMLMLPTKQKIRKNHQLYKYFSTDIERRVYLKKLYSSLTEWGARQSQRLNDKYQNRKIIVNGDYWVL